MPIYFGHSCAPKFSRIFDGHPNLLTRHPYLNFLRDFKKDHPKSGFNRLLQEGARAWTRLSPREKLAYTQKEVMMRSRAYRKRNTLPSKFRVFPRHHIPMAARRRWLSTSKNVKQSWRAVQHLQRPPGVPMRQKLRKLPQMIKI